jgi:hypothetical protein
MKKSYYALLVIVFVCLVIMLALASTGRIVAKKNKLFCSKQKTQKPWGLLGASRTRF